MKELFIFIVEVDLFPISELSQRPLHKLKFVNELLHYNNVFAHLHQRLNRSQSLIRTIFSRCLIQIPG
jgi:hypothetical protein